MSDLTTGKKQRTVLVLLSCGALVTTVALFLYVVFEFLDIYGADHYFKNIFLIDFLYWFLGFIPIVLMFINSFMVYPKNRCSILFPLIMIFQSLSYIRGSVSVVYNWNEYGWTGIYQIICTVATIMFVWFAFNGFNAKWQRTLFYVMWSLEIAYIIGTLIYDLIVYHGTTGISLVSCINSLFIVASEIYFVKNVALRNYFEKKQNSDYAEE